MPRDEASGGWTFRARRSRGRCGVPRESTTLPLARGMTLAACLVISSGSGLRDRADRRLPPMLIQRAFAAHPASRFVLIALGCMTGMSNPVRLPAVICSTTRTPAGTTTRTARSTGSCMPTWAGSSCPATSGLHSCDRYPAAMALLFLLTAPCYAPPVQGWTPTASAVSPHRCGVLGVAAQLCQRDAVSAATE